MNHGVYGIVLPVQLIETSVQSEGSSQQMRATTLPLASTGCILVYSCPDDVWCLLCLYMKSLYTCLDWFVGSFKNPFIGQRGTLGASLKLNSKPFTCKFASSCPSDRPACGFSVFFIFFMP